MNSPKSVRAEGLCKTRDQYGKRGGLRNLGRNGEVCPYGASCVAEVGAELRMPSDLELLMCRFQGEHVAGITRRLVAAGAVSDAGADLPNALHCQDGPIRTVAIGLSQKDFPNGEGHA
jgi:hypothetical protein